VFGSIPYLQCEANEIMQHNQGGVYGIKKLIKHKKTQVKKKLTNKKTLPSRLKMKAISMFTSIMLV